MGVKLDSGFLNVLFVSIFLMFYLCLLRCTVLLVMLTFACGLLLLLILVQSTLHVLWFQNVCICQFLVNYCACIKNFVFCRKKVLDFYQRTSLTAYCTAFAYRPLTRGVSSQLSQVYLELPADSKNLYVSNRSPTPLAWDYRNVLDPHCKSPLGHCRSIGVCSC